MDRTQKFMAIGFVVVVFVGVVLYLNLPDLRSRLGFEGAGQPAPVVASPDKTPDEIFTEVSTQLGFVRSQVGYFIIYGQDRVQYNANLGGGSAVTFAYKDGGVWHIAGPKGSQESPLCSLLYGVPVQYRQACYDEATDTTLYADAQGQNANYPRSEGVVYIGGGQ